MMRNYGRLLCLVAGLAMTFAGSLVAQGGYVTYTDEDSFKAAAGTVEMESFETIVIDGWIYHTRLPSPIPALDLDDDPTDPDDGPNYDLDGHFTITGHSLYGPALEKFIIFDDGSTTDEVDGINFLSFGPWYNVMWPSVFDPNDQHPIVTIDGFDDNNVWINAFGLYFYNYTPGTNWLVLELGSQYVPVNLTGGTGSYFVGVVTDSLFNQVQLHTNQNGGSIKLDEIYYGYDFIPEPATASLTCICIVGLLATVRRRYATLFVLPASQAKT